MPRNRGACLTSGADHLRSRVWQAYLLAGTLAAGVYFVLPQAVQAFGSGVFGLACVAATVVGLRGNRPSRPRAWILFAIGLSLGMAGNLILTYYQLAFDTQPFPSIGDAFFLLGYVVLAAGTSTLIRDRARGADRAAMIDALIISLGVGILVWAFWMVQYAHNPKLSFSTKLVSLAYPLMDIVLLASLARLALGPGKKVASFYLLGLSLLVLLSGDVAFGMTQLAGTYYVGCPVDLPFMLSYVLCGTAALHPSMRAMSTRAPVRDVTLTRSRLVALAAAALVAPLVLGLQALRGVHVDVPVFVGASVVVFLLVVARMWGLMRLLADTASKRALAMKRERTLRRVAATFVGAHDRLAILEVARDAIAVVVDEGTRGGDITAWSISGDAITTVARCSGRTDEARVARLELSMLPDRIRAQLLAGETAEIPSPRGVLQDAVGSGADGCFGIAVPLLVGDSLTGVFTVVSGRALGLEVRESVLTLRDQAALALESATLAADLLRRQAERRLAALFEQSSDVISIIDDAAVISYQTRSVQRVLGYDGAELTGTMLIELVHPEDRGRAQDFLSEALSVPGVSAPIEWRMRRRDGSWRVFENVANNLRENPDVAAIVIDSRDVTERRRLEAQLEYRAFHDDLTDLANRALFHDRTGHALSRLEHSGEQHAVLLLDLDNFKMINDSLGHSTGDQLLFEVAQRLRDCCRRGDTASRLGGDEFAMLLENIEHSDEAIRAADRIGARLREPFIVGGRETFVTSSIGVAVKDEAGTADEIIRNADISMYLAKRRGKARA
jgi:diguanylate cyclase (GGDEF)-like protein/PAS domain S-box-containing protein